MSFHIYFYLCLAIRVRDFYLFCQSSNDKPCQRGVVVIGQLTLKQKWTVSVIWEEYFFEIYNINSLSIYVYAWVYH